MVSPRGFFCCPIDSFAFTLYNVDMRRVEVWPLSFSLTLGRQGFPNPGNTNIWRSKAQRNWCNGSTGAAASGIGSNPVLRSMNYYFMEGTVQPIVVSKDPHFFHHFGRPEYDRNKPVLSDYLREQAQPIVDKLNAGTITREEAKKLLDRL